MDKTLGISLVIGAALGKGYFSTFNTAEQKVTKLGAAMSKTGSQQKSIKSFKQLKRSVQAAEAEMKTATHKVAALAKEIKATDKPSKVMIRNFKAAKRSAAALKQKHSAQTTQLHKLRRELRAAGIDTRKLISHEKKLGRTLDETRRKMLKYNKALAGKKAAADKFTAMRGKALGVIGSAYAATRVVGNGMDLDMRLEALGVQAGESTQSIRELHREMADTANADDIKINPEKITTAIEEIVEKTGNLKFARENIRSIGLALRATGADGMAIGGIMAEMEKMGTFDPETGVLSALDTLTAQGKSGSFTLKDLARQGPRVVTAYNSVVQGARDGATVMREMGAALQMIRMGTGSSEQAATAFERLLSELTNNEKLKKLRDLGIEVFDQEALANGKEQMRPITDLMQEIMVATGGKKTLLGDIFGDEAIRAFNAFKGSVAEVERLSAKFMAISGDGAMLTKDAARLAARSGALWESMGANVTRVGDALSFALLPAINPVIGLFADLMTWVAVGIEKFPWIGQAIGLLTAGFIGYAAVIGIVTAAKWALHTAILSNYFGLIKTVAGVAWAGTAFTAMAVKTGAATAAHWLWNAALMANPIGLVIGGVAALAAGAYLLYDNWDTVTRWFGKALDGLADAFSTIGDAWSSIFGDEEKSVTQRIKQTIEPVKKTALATATAGILAATPAFASTQAQADAGAMSNKTEINNSYQIKVQAAPGMDEKQLADRMMREIKRRESASSRGALHDGPDL